LRNFPHLNFTGFTSSNFIGVDSAPTPLGSAISNAWDLVSGEDRELMVFCWVAKREEGLVCNFVSHPQPTAASAVELIYSVLHDEVIKDRVIKLVNGSDSFL
jgi:hypothetical protein